EPWGWATYHYGRWVYDNGYWAWAPYGYYRNTRSWWFPALVVINIINNNVCWYPLGYHHHYYDYNANYHHGGHHNNPPGVGPTGGIKPIPTRRPADIEAVGGKILPRHTPPATGGNPPPEAKNGRRIDRGPQKDLIPVRGVVTVEAKDFGTNPRGIRSAPPVIANAFLAK